jgi:hypothetical protein
MFASLGNFFVANLVWFWLGGYPTLLFAFWIYGLVHKIKYGSFCLDDSEKAGITIAIMFYPLAIPVIGIIAMVVELLKITVAAQDKLAEKIHNRMEQKRLLALRKPELLESTYREKPKEALHK